MMNAMEIFEKLEQARFAIMAAERENENEEISFDEAFDAVSDLMAVFAEAAGIEQY